MKDSEGIRIDIAMPAQAASGCTPLWDIEAQELIWSDAGSSTVHFHVLSTGAHCSIETGTPVLGLAPRSAGGLIITTETAIGTLDINTGATSDLATVKALLPGYRLSDARTDPSGTLWLGTQQDKPDATDGAVLLRVTDGVTASVVSDDFGSIASIAWSPGFEFMYVLDDGRNTVELFSFDILTGEISDRDTIITFPEGNFRPSGMTIDEDGMLWVCEYGLSRLGRWDPESGKIIGDINLPCSQPVACCFAGDDLDELFVTTAHAGLDEAALEEEPDAGALLRILCGVRGFASVPFSGS